MATPPSTVSGAEADSSALHTYYCLRSKLEESKQNLRDLKERYLTARATAFFLANHLQKHGESPSAVGTQLTNGDLSSSGKGSPLHSSLPNAHTNQGAKHLAILCCFPRYCSKELDMK